MECSVCQGIESSLAWMFFVFFTGHRILPVPEEPGPGRLQAGRKTLIPAVQRGPLGLRNRCCAVGTGWHIAPREAPCGRAPGLHPVGCDTALPPIAAAFFAPFCGKAVKEKEKVKLNSRG